MTHPYTYNKSKDSMKRISMIKEVVECCVPCLQVHVCSFNERKAKTDQFQIIVDN